jgi:hypothetical protein
MKGIQNEGRVAGGIVALFCILFPGSFAAAAPIVVAGLYTENAGAGCAAGSVCQLVFSAIALGKQLEVQRVSCAITEQVDRLAFVKFGVKKADGHVTREAYLSADLLGGEAGNFRHVVNSEVDLITRGAQPMIEVVSDLVTTFALACQISGQITNVPN